MTEIEKFVALLWDSKMAADISNISHLQPELSQALPSSTFKLQDALPDFLLGWSVWQYVVTIFLGVVVYDQGTCNIGHFGILCPLTRFLVMYIKRKGSIAGPPLKIPLMGPFLQAIHPQFESYLAQWASGPLSCVSVFHKYVPQPGPSRL